MQEFKIIEYNNVRVLTTKQLAEAYETDGKTISKNFNRNKSRYEEGKHFIRLSGNEKIDFINRRQFGDGSSKAKYLYLWTEKGAFLHAKSLNTDKAWEVYERLMDFYFAKKEELPVKTVTPILPYSFPMTATVPAPLRPDWYAKNKRKLRRVCDKMDISHRELYHEILKALGKTYDINAAREIYKRDRGYYPEYAIDIVGYFPELAVAADRILNMLQ